MSEVPLIIENYIPAIPAFQIKRPDIKSGSNYYFNTDSGLTYEVTFGKKKNNYLGNIINFGVQSDDFEDEYSETNKGEVWRIIATIIEITRIYHENHSYSNSYEFSGEYKKKENENLPSIRTRMFFRSLKRVIDFRFWEASLENNRIILSRKANEQSHP